MHSGRQDMVRVLIYTLDTAPFATVEPRKLAVGVVIAHEALHELDLLESGIDCRMQPGNLPLVEGRVCGPRRCAGRVARRTGCRPNLHHGTKQGPGAPHFDVGPGVVALQGARTPGRPGLCCQLTCSRLQSHRSPTDGVSRR